MEDMSTRSGNKLTEEQIEQLIKRLRGVEHIEPIVTMEDSNVNNEKMATFAEVVNNQSNNKNNTDESDSKHGEQNKDYASGDSVKPLLLVDQDVFGSTKPDRTHWLTNVEIYKAVGSKEYVNLAVISGKRDIFDFNADGIRSKSLRIPRILCEKGYAPTT
jgi:hypothetical protein